MLLPEIFGVTSGGGSLRACLSFLQRLMRVDAVVKHAFWWRCDL